MGTITHKIFGLGAVFAFVLLLSPVAHADVFTQVSTAGTPVTTTVGFEVETVAFMELQCGSASFVAGSLAGTSIASTGNQIMGDVVLAGTATFTAQQGPDGTPHGCEDNPCGEKNGYNLIGEVATVDVIFDSVNSSVTEIYVSSTDNYEANVATPVGQFADFSSMTVLNAGSPTWSNTVPLNQAACGDAVAGGGGEITIVDCTDAAVAEIPELRFTVCAEFPLSNSAGFEQVIYDIRSEVTGGAS